MKGFEKRVACVGVVQDGQAGRNVVAEVVELLTGADRHEECGGAFLGGEFGKVNRIVYRVDATAEVQVTGGDQAAAQGPAQQGAAQRQQGSETQSRAAAGRVERAQLHGVLVLPGVAFADERAGLRVEVLLGETDAFLEGTGNGVIQDSHAAAGTFVHVDAVQARVFVRAAGTECPHLP